MRRTSSVTSVPETLAKRKRPLSSVIVRCVVPVTRTWAPAIASCVPAAVTVPAIAACCAEALRGASKRPHPISRVHSAMRPRVVGEPGGRTACARGEVQQLLIESSKQREEKAVPERRRFGTKGCLHYERASRAASDRAIISVPNHFAMRFPEARQGFGAKSPRSSGKSTRTPAARSSETMSRTMPRPCASVPTRRATTAFSRYQAPRRLVRSS